MPLQILMKLSANVCKIFFNIIGQLFVYKTVFPSAFRNHWRYRNVMLVSLLAGYSILQSFFSKSAVCWFIVTNLNKKFIRHFYSPSIFTFMNCKELKKFGNRKYQKTLPVTLFGPLVAILNFAQKCKQTAVSQELSMVN